MCSEISSRDLREDDFSDMDYYRAGLDPTDTFRNSLLQHGDGLKDSLVSTREMEDTQRKFQAYTNQEMEEITGREMEEDQTYCVRESESRESSDRGDSLQEDLDRDMDRVSLQEDAQINPRNRFKSKIPRIQVESRY